MDAKQLRDRIGHNTAYHPPSSPAIVAAHQHVRDATATFMHELVDTCPIGRELFLALTAAEEALMWANAAIARAQATAT